MKPLKPGHFEPEGVLFKRVPTGYKVVPIEEPDPESTHVPEGINLIRNVGKFDLEDSKGEKVEPDTIFDEPLEIRVRWTPADAKKAADNDRELYLIIDFGNGWKKASNHHEVQMLPEDDYSLGGVAILKINRWGDATVGWAD